MNINWNFPESNYSQRLGISEAGIETFRGSLFSSLAKEICQNSLDAIFDSNHPVSIEFSKFEIDTSAIPGFDSLNDALISCLECESDTKAKKFFENACKKMRSKKINVLRVSDFNTTGLKGAKEPQNSINPWQSLIKSSGISNKSGTSGGSYGIGKSAPFACSEIRTIFYTTFDTDNTLATQGVSRLISFPTKNNSDKFTQGIGYYGEIEKNGPIFEELNLDPNFNRRGTTGTDLYIIGFLENSKWKEELIFSILENFLIAIYNNNLTVKIDDVIISSSTLYNVINNFKINEKKNYKKSIGDYYNVLISTTEFDHNLDSFYSEETFKDLGEFELRILYDDLNRRVLMSRSNGMKIFDLDRLPSVLKFSAVFILKSEKLNSYFREMETPQHNNWEPDRHSDPNAKHVLSELKKLIRNKIIELGKNNNEEKMDATGIGNFLPDNLIFLDNKKQNDKIDKISSKTKNIEVQQLENIPKQKKKNLETDLDNLNINNVNNEFFDEEFFEESPFGDNTLFNDFSLTENKNNKNNSSNLEFEFSILGDGKNSINVKKINLISDVDIRLIVTDKKLKKYKLILTPKKNIKKAAIKISIAGEQSNLKAKIRHAFKNENISLPLTIKQNKIYINDLKENEKNSISFILNYSDDCSMEVELYEYTT